MSSIHLIFITYNRLDYTRKALESILADPSEEFSLTIWDNASSDGTPDYLRSVSDPRIAELVLSKENIGQTAAVNRVWSASKADLLGKLDNDCLMTPGWTRTLSRAHDDIPDLGVVACWHFFADDFDEARARHKIEHFGDHQIFRHAFTCGTGLLIKRRHYTQIGPMRERATTAYWLQMGLAGLICGYYYPLVFQEHMDDPKSEHSVLKDEASFQAAKAVTFSLTHQNQETLDDRWRWRRDVIDNILDDPYDPKYYTGWRRKIRGARARLRRLFS